MRCLRSPLVIFFSAAFSSLFFFFLALLAAAVPHAAAAGTTLLVPDDYGTIQAAINAAAPGDTIRVRGGTGAEIPAVYLENLSITKPITLSGGWDSTFTAQTADTTVVNGQGLGRVISITTAGPETVLIDDFILVNGDATGLGGIDAEQLAAAEYMSATRTLSIQASMQAAERQVQAASSAAPIELSTALAWSAAAGRLPATLGSLSEIMERLNQWEVRSGRYAAAQAAHTIASETQIDCGGALFSRNAGLHLTNNRFAMSYASRSGDGRGGGVCIVDAPASTVQISANTFEYGTASVTGIGEGGGLYLANATGAILRENRFAENVATGAGADGLGGGIFFEQADATQVVSNTFESNAASTSPMVNSSGIGGAIYGRNSSGVTMSGNKIGANLAALYRGGLGGGVYLFHITGALLTDNIVNENWGVVYDYVLSRGGGIGLGDCSQVTITGNEIRGNVAGFNATSGEVFVTVAGGGIFAATVSGVLLDHNTISENVGTVTSKVYMDARGGGLAVDTSRSGPSESWTISHNLIDKNIVAANTAQVNATGGGLRLTVLGSRIQDNMILDNRASGEKTAVDGLLVEGALESTVVSSGAAEIEGNLILGDPQRPLGERKMGLSIGATDGFTVTNNIIANHAVGLSLYGSFVLPAAYPAKVINNTFVNGDVGVVANYLAMQPIELVNNIIVSQTVAITVGANAMADASYNLLYGNIDNFGGAGIITSTHVVTGFPAFMDPAAGNYDLLPSSAAVDAGDPAGIPPAPAADIAGTVRPQYTWVDIGAYEADFPRFYLPLIGK